MVYFSCVCKIGILLQFLFNNQNQLLISQFHLLPLFAKRLKTRERELLIFTLVEFHFWFTQLYSYSDWHNEPFQIKHFWSSEVGASISMFIGQSVALSIGRFFCQKSLKVMKKAAIWKTQKHYVSGYISRFNPGSKTSLE